MDHLHNAGETIAQAIKQTIDSHTGWSKYTPAGDAAIRALVEAGWTPPTEGDTELERLHQALAAQQDEVAWAWEHTYRIEAERDAAGAFRARFLDLWWQLQQQLTTANDAARTAREPEPTYTGEQVLDWLQKILNLADKTADRVKVKELKQKPATPPAEVQDRLFEAAS